MNETIFRTALSHAISHVLLVEFQIASFIRIDLIATVLYSYTTKYEQPEMPCFIPPAYERMTVVVLLHHCCRTLDCRMPLLISPELFLASRLLQFRWVRFYGQILHELVPSLVLFPAGRE